MPAPEGFLRQRKPLVPSADAAIAADSLPSDPESLAAADKDTGEVVWGKTPGGEGALPQGGWRPRITDVVRD